MEGGVYATRMLPPPGVGHGSPAMLPPPGVGHGSPAMLPPPGVGHGSPAMLPPPGVGHGSPAMLPPPGVGHGSPAMLPPPGVGHGSPKNGLDDHTRVGPLVPAPAMRAKTKIVKIVAKITATLRFIGSSFENDNPKP